MHVATVQQNIAEAGSGIPIFCDRLFVADEAYMSGQTAILKMPSSNMFEE